MVPAHTLAALGWPEILAALAGRCRTPMGVRRAAATPFLDGAEEVRFALATVAEARALSEGQWELPLGGIPDVSEALTRAAKDGVLEPLALRACATFLSAAFRTREFLTGRAASFPRLAALAARLSDERRLAAAIERAIEPSGTVADHASPALAELRDRVRGLHGQIKGRIETLLGDEEIERGLRDRYFTIRNERYVLPVKAGARSEIPGIVHNASQSGQTLFVEPEAIVGLGNELSIAQAMALEEEQRILRELSEGLGARQAALQDDLETLGELDLLEARARLASDLDAHAPAIEPGGGPVVLRGLRHPLLVLQKKAVVANDLLLEPPALALVVSGPNAGGKTISISAVGIAALMLRAGLPVAAAEGSRLPLFRYVGAAIDERGDLHRDLSTFTAHLSAIRDMLAELGEDGTGALVLVDEIAADTDPREGAALAVALLEELVERGTVALVTTHLEELKALALADPRFANARVGFDTEKLAPTYRLHLGSPGSSSALEVAHRIGLPGHILERARAAQSLGPGGGALPKALAALESERARLDAERSALARARAEAEESTRKAEARADEAARASKEAEARIRAELAAELDLARAEAAAILRKAQGAPTVRTATEAQAAIAALQQKSASASEAAKAHARPEARPGKVIAPGVRVRIVSLRQEAEVIEVGAGEAQLRVGSLRVRRPLADLVPLAPPTGPAPSLKPSRQETIARAEAARPEALLTPSRRLDARGLRVEELLREVERFLDALYGEGEPDCVILHGHGTGALKAALRDHLGASPYVARFRPGDRHEGGDAVTVVTFRR